MGQSSQIHGDETVTIEIPAGLYAALEKEGRRRRQPIPKLLAAMLEDQADHRAAETVMKRVEAGTEKTHSIEEVSQRLGL